MNSSKLKFFPIYDSIILAGPVRAELFRLLCSFSLIFKKNLRDL